MSQQQFYSYSDSNQPQTLLLFYYKPGHVAKHHQIHPIIFVCTLDWFVAPLEM